MGTMMEIQFEQQWTETIDNSWNIVQKCYLLQQDWIRSGSSPVGFEDCIIYAYS